MADDNAEGLLMVVGSIVFGGILLWIISGTPQYHSEPGYIMAMGFLLFVTLACLLLGLHGLSKKRY